MKVSPVMETLEAKGLVQVAAYRPELEYLFRHWLVQDAAYGSLLKQERRQLHRLVGEALEGLYPERRNELAGILAMHFEEAGDSAKALDYFIVDGQYALDRAALTEAFDAFDRAKRLLPAAQPDDPDTLARRRVEIEVLRARAGTPQRPPDDVVADLEAIAPAAEELGDLELLAQVYLYLALALTTEGGQPANDPAARRALDRLEEIGRELDDPSLTALPLAMVGMGKIHTGPIREGVEALETAIPLMEKRRDFIGAAFSRGWLAIGYATLGEFDHADAAVAAAAREAADGDLIAQLDADIAESIVRSSRGELDSAAPLAMSCIERSEETGATACGVVSAFVLGDVYQRQRRHEDARAAFQLGLDLAPGMTAGMWGPTLRAWLRASAEAVGEAAPDSTDFEEGLDLARRYGNHLGEAGILWKRAESRVTLGMLDEALTDYVDSAAIYEAEGARPDLARVLRGQGQTLLRAGRREAAEEPLRRALALFEAMGLGREATEVTTELTSGATSVDEADASR